MLDALRRSAAGWVAKIFLGVLVLSFAVWGVADIFGGYGSQSLARIGDTEVSTASFSAAYQRELSAMADRLGRQLTTDEARALGVDRRVLRQLLTTAAITNHARDLNLGVSDEYVGRQIATDPTFFNAFGEFDRDRFQSLLRYSGYSEGAYVAEQKQVAMRQQLTQAVSGDLEAPDVLIDAFRAYQGAKRVVDYIVLPAIDPASLAAPAETTLKEFYSREEQQFTTPELRALTLIVVEPDTLTGAIEVPEADIEAEYAARRDQYETPERRAVDQILFSGPEAANAAHQKIVDGADFLALAAEEGFSASDVDLGTVAQSDIVDPKIAEVAFSLEAGAVSGPVTGGLGVAIVRVRSIEPGMTRPLEEVRGEIRDRLALELARDEVLNLYDEVEDERAAGATLGEIAGKLNLGLIEIAASDRRGRDGQGEPVSDLPPIPELLRGAFESEVGIENDAVETATGGFVWYEVTAVIPPELKPFDTVRDRVEKLWREQEVATRLGDRAADLAERGNTGTPLAALAEEVGVTVQTSEPFTRRAPTTPFAPSLVEAVFSVPTGEFLRGSGREDGQQVVVVVREALPADELAAREADALVKDAAFAIRNDLYEQYVTGLQAREGVTVNEPALNALFGDAG